jgi:hypothetical protein
MWLSLALMLAAGAPAVKAHSFYSQFCCNDQDCQPIPTRAVQVTPRGYLVTLRPSDHKMLSAEPAPVQYLVPFSEAKESPDGGYHACILPYALTTMRCLYVPPAGS